jgi:hypothetical protein
MTGVVGALKLVGSPTRKLSYDCLSSIRHTVHVFVSDSRDIHWVLVRGSRLLLKLPILCGCFRFRCVKCFFFLNIFFILATYIL